MRGVINYLKRILAFSMACVLMIASMGMSIFASEGKVYNKGKATQMKKYKADYKSEVIEADVVIEEHPVKLEDIVDEIKEDEITEDEKIIDQTDPSTGSESKSEPKDEIKDDSDSDTGAESNASTNDTKENDSNNNSTNNNTDNKTGNYKNKKVFDGESSYDDWEFYDEDEFDELDDSDDSSNNTSGSDDEIIDDEEDILPDMMSGEYYYDYESEKVHFYKDGITDGRMRRQETVKRYIVDYANSLNGHFTSPYRKNGRAVAIQCCAYVNQVWHDVFGTDLYSLSDAATNKYSKDGESAYEFFERVGLKTGDVIYTRYQKVKRGKNGNIIKDKNGNPVKTMGQHFLIILDYDDQYVWYTDGYESKGKGFIVSSINRKVKYSDSKYFKNLGGAYSNIEGAYFARAGKRGTRFRYYRLPESRWSKRGGNADILKKQREHSKRYVATEEIPQEQEEIQKKKRDAWEYDPEEISENKAARQLEYKTTEDMLKDWPGDEGELWISSLENEEYEYDSTLKEPEIRVFSGIKCLEKDKDYTVEYTDNLNAGTATVWVRGSKGYRGTVSENFIIKPYDLSAHYEEGTVLVKPIEIKANGRKRRVKPLVKCIISENEISETEDESGDGEEAITVEDATAGNKEKAVDDDYDDVPEISRRKSISRNTISKNSISKNGISKNSIDVDDEESSDERKSRDSQDNREEQNDSKEDQESQDNPSEIKGKLIRLKAGESCKYKYLDKRKGAYKNPSDEPYIIYVQGKGNFTGIIKVEEYIIE